jgi:orotidine-5'-phosphate decarboxylase
MPGLEYNPVIIALDVSDRARMRQMVKELHPYVGKFKVGLEMFVGFGPDVVREIHDMGGRVMLDLKLHDIPNTVKHAAKNASKLGVDLLTIHTAGGIAMMQAAKAGVIEGAEESGNSPTQLLGITVLTSLDQDVLTNELGVNRSVQDQVVILAKNAQAAGLDGVVSSPQEVPSIREACGSEFLVVTPGIRLATSGMHDQKRVMTPEDAIAAGASYIVVGRAVTQADDPVDVMKKILTGIRVEV